MAMRRIAPYTLSILLSSPCALGESIEKDRLVREVDILTSPAEAMLYIDGKKLGLSPQSILLERKANAYTKVTALPVYPHHHRQDVVLSRGEPPEQLKIYLDITPIDSKKGGEEEKAQKPECVLASHEPPLIYFDTNVYQLSQEQEHLLADWACLLKKNGAASQVYVYGQTDYRGDTENNDVLALKRADAVKAALIRAEFPEERIKTHVYGEVHTKSSALAPLALNENRRAILELRSLTAEP